MQQHLSPAQEQRKMLLRFCPSPKGGDVDVVLKTVYTTGLQPDSTVQPVVTVQYIQRCIYPPPRSISSRPNLTLQTRYFYSPDASQS